MTSTFMTMHHSIHSMSTSATTMSTYGINYFNDTCSSGGECSDGYQSSISPVASPALGHYNYNPDNYGYASYSPKKTYNYQNDCSYYQQTASNFTATSCSFKSTPNQVDYSQNSYKLNVQIKPYIKSCESTSISKSPAPPKVSKVNRFVQQFNQQHEDLSKKFLEQKDVQDINLPPPPPEILKKRRVAANARERRRMNNLNFAFDR